jgi:uncharacterized protein
MSELLLDLSQMREAQGRVERTYAADDLALEGDLFRIAGPVALSLAIQKDRLQYRLSGTVQTTLELVCSRCLVAFPMPVDERFDVRYLPHAEARTDGEVEIEDDDLSTAFYRDQRIDLGHLIQEQFVLTVPMKPLCKDSCQGLCPLCGNNRNTEPCACAVSWEDPRLAVLRRLKKDK